MRISDWISDVCSSDLVIVDPDGHATLIDLGAARPRGSAIATTVAGVLGFIPPERSTGPGDHRSDAWALGLTAISALPGHPPGRSEERRVRQEWVNTFRSLWSPYH